MPLSEVPAVDAGGPTVVARREQVLSPWVTVVARDVQGTADAPVRTFHSLRQADYVCAVARTPEGAIPFVRQFRPALERVTLELPAGLVDAGESAAATVARELEEEVGLRAVAPGVDLGSFDPDSARLENGLRGFFFAATEAVDEWVPEPGVEPLLLSPPEVAAAIADGSLRHALHIAMLGICVLRGLLDLPLVPVPSPDPRS